MIDNRVTIERGGTVIGVVFRETAWYRYAVAQTRFGFTVYALARDPKNNQDPYFDNEDRGSYDTLVAAIRSLDL